VPDGASVVAPSRSSRIDSPASFAVAPGQRLSLTLAHRREERLARGVLQGLRILHGELERERASPGTPPRRTRASRPRPRSGRCRGPPRSPRSARTDRGRPSRTRTWRQDRSSSGAARATAAARPSPRGQGPGEGRREPGVPEFSQYECHFRVQAEWTAIVEACPADAPLLGDQLDRDVLAPDGTGGRRRAPLPLGNATARQGREEDRAGEADGSQPGGGHVHIPMLQGSPGRESGAGRLFHQCRA
jgi:hypothetical protein